MLERSTQSVCVRIQMIEKCAYGVSFSNRSSKQSQVMNFTANLRIAMEPSECRRPWLQARCGVYTSSDTPTNNINTSRSVLPRTFRYVIWNRSMYACRCWKSVAVYHFTRALLMERRMRSVLIGCLLRKTG